MNNERNNTTAGGIGFCGLLAVAFIVIVLVAILVRELTKGGRP